MQWRHLTGEDLLSQKIKVEVEVHSQVVVTVPHELLLGLDLLGVLQGVELWVLRLVLARVHDHLGGPAAK